LGTLCRGWTESWWPPPAAQTAASSPSPTRSPSPHSRNQQSLPPQTLSWNSLSFVSIHPLTITPLQEPAVLASTNPELEFIVICYNTPTHHHPTPGTSSPSLVLPPLYTNPELEFIVIWYNTPPHHHPTPGTSSLSLVLPPLYTNPELVFIVIWYNTPPHLITPLQEPAALHLIRLHKP
jgi:hypothetical protein